MIDSRSVFDRFRRWYDIAVHAHMRESEVDEAFAFAKQWCYQGVIFDLTRDSSSVRELIVNSALASHAMSGFQEPVAFRVSANEANMFISRDVGRVAHWNIVLNFPDDLSLVEDIGRLAAPGRDAVTIRFVSKEQFEDAERAVKALITNSEHRRIHLEFPFAAVSSGTGFLHEKPIERRVSHLRSTFKTVDFLPPIGWGLEDPELPKDERPYPKPDVIFEREIRYSGSSQSKIEISIVIPTYERCIELSNTLRHLFRQKFPKDQMEIIVVDCGSHDATTKDVEKLADSEGRDIRFTLLRLARPLRRRMGDSRYRASYARNIGASKAKGRILSFLDDDMLVPRDYFAKVAFQYSDPNDSIPPKVLMAERLDLKEELFGVRLTWDEIDSARDTRVADRGLWRDFYSQAEGWMSWARPWRFLCSHSLSLPQETFKKVGWFRENFVSYGFEDGELGSRLVDAGAKLEVLEAVVYHQNRGPVRSEFGGSHRRKLRLLSRAARVFWRHTLKPEVWQHCRYLFRRPLGFWLLVGEIKGGGPLWRYRRRRFN